MKYLLYSGLISLVCGILIFTSIWKLSDPIGDFIIGFYPFETGTGILSSIAEWGSRIALLYIAVMTYKYVVLIVTAPIMSILSEKIEFNSDQINVDRSQTGFFKSIIRGVRISIRNLSLEILLSGLVFFIGIFTGIGIIGFPLLFVIQAYYAGFGNYDFFLERHMGVRETVKFMRRNRISAIINGGIFLAILAIPFLGFLIAPAFATTASSLEGIRKLS